MHEGAEQHEVRHALRMACSVFHRDRTTLRMAKQRKTFQARGVHGRFHVAHHGLERDIYVPVREPAATLAERLVDIALGGLERRGLADAAGRDEQSYLEPLAELVLHGKCPADAVLDGLSPGEILGVPEIIARTRLLR
jgi:gamma-glutamylcysteine synthetase